MTFVLPAAPTAQVRELLERDGPQALVLQLLTLHPVEITEALEALDHESRLNVVRALPANIAAQVLLNADAEFRSGLLARLSPTALAHMLDRLPVERAAQLLEQLDTEKQTAVVAAADPTNAAQMAAVRRCPAGSVGRLLVRLVPRVHTKWSVAETFRYLRRASSELDRINTLYVLDDDAILVGVLSLREIIEAEPHTHLIDLMQTRVLMVTPETDREEAAHLVSRYNLPALPVVDARHRLLGVVTVDDLVDVLIQENTEDVLKLGAVSGGDSTEAAGSYWTGRIGSAVRKRAPWLLALAALEGLTCLALRGLGPSLMLFVPLVLGTAGIFGAQTVTTMVRGMAVGEIRERDMLKVLLRECATGAMLALALALLLVAGALAGGLGTRFAVAGAVSLFTVCLWANVMGGLVPLLARRAGFDPSLVSAPLITTLVDATGLALYFQIAGAMLR